MQSGATGRNGQVASRVAAGRMRVFPNVQNIGLLTGPVLALFLIIAVDRPEGLSFAALATGALMVWMAIWWATEAVPIPVTSLLPLVVLPLIGEGTPMSVGASYGHHIVWLLFGGFVIAVGIERWNLHQRIALNIVVRAGTSRKALVLGFMVATALLSMWISNTATTLMIVPIALSAAAALKESDGRFVSALLLSICYAASIGGIATPIGTPTNLIAMDWLQRETGESISFPQWMAIGVPAACLLIPCAWWITTRTLPSGRDADVLEGIRKDLSSLGSVSTPEKRIALLFVIIAFLWISRLWLVRTLDAGGWNTLAGFSGSKVDMMIAILGAVAAFIVPAGPSEKRPLLEWEEAARIPWGVLILFGGGIALGNAVKSTGLSVWLGGNLEALGVLPTLLFVAAVVAMVIFLTELTSNVATMTTLAPILGAMAAGIGAHAASFLAPAAIAASCAFMLPVATAPNAIVYATNSVPLRDMTRKGFQLNLLGIGIITLIGFFLAPLVV